MKVYSFVNGMDHVEHFTSFRKAQKAAITLADRQQQMVLIHLDIVQVSARNMINALNGAGYSSRHEHFTTVYPKGNKT